MRYLYHLPDRLSRHSSLDASAKLFCTAWSDYDTGKEFQAFSLYDTALVELKKSLAPILKDSAQPSAEIVAATALLERTEALFMQGPRSYRINPHIRALGDLLKQKGPPLDLDDKFDVILTHEIRWMVVS
jgi:hypothetical protein